MASGIGLLWQDGLDIVQVLIDSLKRAKVSPQNERNRTNTHQDRDRL